MGMRLDGWWAAFFLAVIIHIAVWIGVGQGLLREVALEPKIEYMEIEMTPPARPMPKSQAPAQAPAVVPAGRPNNSVVNNAQGRATLPAASPGAAATPGDAMPAAAVASGGEPGAVAAISGGYGAAAGAGGTGSEGTGSAAAAGASGAEREPDRRPSIAYAPPPEYPTVARRNQWEGTVLVSIRVTASGSVAEASVAKSSGYDALDAAAVAAVYRWQFNPASRDGQPVSGRVKVPINFDLSK